MASPAILQTPRLVAADRAAGQDILGIVVTTLVSNQETRDQFGVFEALIPPGAGIPLHRHPDVELFYILEGQLCVVREVNGAAEEFVVARDQGGFIPADANHGFVNNGVAPARALITCTRGLEAFLAEAGRPAKESAGGPPTGEEVERVLAIARKHGQVFPGMASSGD
ncbi:MAG TPA: cupin domain-containing protein [Acidobacteriaceae bacterium]|nr:cupin domain-containing protein [Acidobacteriaceae bacterium]